MSTDELPMLRELLRAYDPVSITQGVELACALGPEVVDGLLHKVDLHHTPWEIWPLPVAKRRFVSRRVQHFQDTPTFYGLGYGQEWEYAIAGLVSRGTGARASDLRKRTRSLLLGGAYRFAHAELDLALLDGLVHLEELALWNVRGRNLDQLVRTLPRLHRLRVNTAYWGAVDLDGLAAANLEELELVSRGLNLDALRGARVTRLIVRDPTLEDVRAIGTMPCLESLHLECAGNFAGVAAAPRLREALLRGKRPGLTNLGTLPHARILRCPWTSAAGLTAAPELETLEVGSLVELPPLPNVRRLEMDRLEETAPLPALEEVECTHLVLPRLADLATWPRLARVTAGAWVNAGTAEGTPPFEFRWTGKGATRLSVRGRLTSLRDLSNVTGITLLDLHGCTELVSLDGVEGMRTLRGLDLRGCTSLVDVTALAGLDLRVVLTHGGPVAVPPEHQWAVDARVSRRRLQRLLALDPQVPPPTADS